VRAKELFGSGLAYETPRGENSPSAFFGAEVVYLIFKRLHRRARQDWLRPQLCFEALRLGRVLTAIAPHEPKPMALALMELHASRSAARTDDAGDPSVAGPESAPAGPAPDPAWDAGAGAGARIGRSHRFYALQAAIVPAMRRQHGK